jgi:hypothetical protein
MTEAFDVDDEPMPTAKNEDAVAISGHQIVMRRGDTPTADTHDQFYGFVQEELAVLFEENNTEIAYL